MFLPIKPDTRYMFIFWFVFWFVRFSLIFVDHANLRDAWVPISRDNIASTSVRKVNEVTS